MKIFLRFFDTKAVEEKILIHTVKLDFAPSLNEHIKFEGTDYVVYSSEIEVFRDGTSACSFNAMPAKDTEGSRF